MAFHFEMFSMVLGTDHVDLFKGHVLALFRGSETFAHVRVTTLEEATRLEVVAQRVSGRWRPNYRHEDTSLSVSEFEAKVAKNPTAFAEPIPAKVKKAAPTAVERKLPSATAALGKVRSFDQAREADDAVVRDGLTYGDCRALASLVQTLQGSLEAIGAHALEAQNTLRKG